MLDEARTSFAYVGPTWFWFEERDGPPESEADLLLSIDGKAIVCEAKSSWGGLRVDDIQKLEALALKLKPDTALLAVMEECDSPTAKRLAIEQAQARLAQHNIELRIITSKTHPVEDDPHLR